MLSWTGKPTVQACSFYCHKNHHLHRTPRDGFSTTKKSLKKNLGHKFIHITFLIHHTLKMGGIRKTLRVYKLSSWLKSLYSILFPIRKNYIIISVENLIIFIRVSSSSLKIFVKEIPGLKIGIHSWHEIFEPENVMMNFQYIKLLKKVFHDEPCLYKMINMLLILLTQNISNQWFMMHHGWMKYSM